MKIHRIPFNKIKLILTDLEVRELALILERGLDNIIEYHDESHLSEHSVNWYENTIKALRGLANNKGD